MTSAATPAPDLHAWWEQYGPEYRERTWLDYRHLLAEVVRFAPRPPLVDVGCGYGFLVECARQFGMSAVGLESSPHALEQCRLRHPATRVLEWTAGTALPLEDGSAGVVMLNQVIDHFTMAENRALFADIARVLAPEGVVIVHSPSRFNTDEIDTGHVTFFSPLEFRQFVVGYGFRVVWRDRSPRAMFGRSRGGWLAARLMNRVASSDRLAANIDLVAQKNR